MVETLWVNGMKPESLKTHVALYDYEHLIPVGLTCENIQTKVVNVLWVNGIKPESLKTHVVLRDYEHLTPVGPS